MKVVIIGARGQLGSDLTKVFGSDAIPLTHEDIEVTNLESCKNISKFDPDAIINTAAFHKTDDCELMPEKTFQVNAVGAKNIAEISEQIGAVDIFISTDYVFDGLKDGLYTEDDLPNPINTYGISKLAGEIFTRNYNKKHYVVRVASLFGVAGASGKGGNFIETMIRKAKEGADLKVVDDIMMTPTYTYDAAVAIKELLEKKAPYGTYHVVNTGATTWYKFAKEIFDVLNMNANLKPTTSSEYKTRAKRPKNSALSNEKLKALGIQMRTWQDALKAYLKEKGHLK